MVAEMLNECFAVLGGKSSTANEALVEVGLVINDGSLMNRWNVVHQKISEAERIFAACASINFALLMLQSHMVGKKCFVFEAGTAGVTNARLLLKLKRNSQDSSRIKQTEYFSPPPFSYQHESNECGSPSHPSPRTIPRNSCSSAHYVLSSYARTDRALSDKCHYRRRRNIQHG